MIYDFDAIIDRRETDSAKWRALGPDLLPLWVADMDFKAPQPVIDALRERVEHGIFGYGVEPERLKELIVERMARLYSWQIEPGDIQFVPGVVPGFNLACHAMGQPGEGALVQTPVYFPMLDAPANAGLSRQEMQLSRGEDGRYSVDLDIFERAIVPQTKLFLLCSPHNPVGRVFTRSELKAMAEICLRHDIIICSDEIHCDLLLDGRKHIPIASIDPEIAARTITFMAPSKTFNIAGLHGSFAIVQNPELRARLQAARRGLIAHVNILAFTAAIAAYESGEDWLRQCLDYLQGNYDLLAKSLPADLPSISVSPIEGTYLAWLDCRQAGLGANPDRFFRQRAGVALVDGAMFGRGGEGFLRLNFGCSRAVLREALERMAEALRKRSSEPHRSAG